MTDKQFEGKMREAAKKSRISCPEDYDAFICEILQNLPDTIDESEDGLHRKQKRDRGMWKPVPAFLISCVIVIAVGGTVGAVVRDYLKRMESMSEKEKEGYISTTEDAANSADNYSREFTKEEKQRGKQLAEEYKQGKRYPQNKLVVLEDASKVAALRLCFLSTNSTFYLPEDTLSDEELLEIIDFYIKREYSMTENSIEMKQKKEKQRKEKEGEISKKEAIRIAAEYIKMVYGMDMSAWECQVEKYTPYHLKGKYYLCWFQNKAFPQKYIVDINGETKEFTDISVEYTDGSQSSKEYSVSSHQIRQVGKSALEIVKKLDSELTVDSIKCQYMGKNKKASFSTYIDFIVFHSEKKGIVFNYDLDRQVFIGIGQWEQISEYIWDYQSRADKKQCNVFKVECDESNVAEKEAD